LKKQAKEEEFHHNCAKQWSCCSIMQCRKPQSQVKQNKYATSPHPNILPTNNGTHRITIKWPRPPDNVREYEKDKNNLSNAIHGLLTSEIFPEEIEVLYQWKNADVVLSKAASKVEPFEIRDFITQKVTQISDRSQMIFGIRFGFIDNPNRWRNSALTKAILNIKHSTS
jgi:hypothetical protein